MSMRSTGTAVAVICALALAGGAAARAAEPSENPPNAVASAPGTDPESCGPRRPRRSRHTSTREGSRARCDRPPSTRVWVEVMLSVTYTASAAGPSLWSLKL